MLALVVAGCSGGGGGSSPLSIGFDLASSSETEGTVAAITLVLASKSGPLTEPASVTVQDLGNGTSVGGADHDFTADRIVTFPIGSDDGATQVVNVSATGDLAIEGRDEILRLALSDPSTGVGLGRKSHTLTIEDADMATLAFSAETSSTTDEATPHTVSVELQLDPGEILTIDIDVGVLDERTGSATSGVDYMHFSTETLTFPSGSADGTIRSVMVTPLGDLAVEGDETAMLIFENPSDGVEIAGTGSHMVTITDDDLSGLAHLVVTGTLQGGAPSATSSGDLFPLGSASLDSGPNGALELTLQNAGAQTMDLEPLVLTGDTRDFTIDLMVEPSPLVLANPVVFPFAVVEDDAVSGSRLELDGELCAALEDSQAVVMDGVELPGGGSVTLQLERTQLPFTDDAIVRIDGVDVPARDAVGDLSMWRGSVPELPDSEAFLAISSEGSHGWVRLGEDLGTVHLITEYSNGEPEVHWLWDAQLDGAYTGELPGQCGGALVPPGMTLDNTLPDLPQSQSMSVGLTLPDCRLAIETDYQFWQEFNDTTAATQYATQLIAAVSDVYERDVQTSLSIAYLGIHSNSNDGWTTPDGGGSTHDMLDEFQAAWTGDWPVEADLAHFISGASLGGGVAYVGVICSQSFGFGVSANINGNINWGSFSGNPSVSNWDFVVVAHELGHNFGALHTHDYCPPLDRCSANCEAGTNCPEGTVMSYCHTCGGMANIRLEFHAHIAEQMRAEVDSSCLAEAELAPGGTISLSVSFEPTSSAGGKTATLELSHDAPNAPTPFQLNLSGTALN